MPDLNPEQRAREQIDAQLLACGWVVQDYSMARQIRATLSRESPVPEICHMCAKGVNRIKGGSVKVN
jgi:hypothetical protein